MGNKVSEDNTSDDKKAPHEMDTDKALNKTSNMNGSNGVYFTKKSYFYTIQIS